VKLDIKYVEIPEECDFWQEFGQANQLNGNLKILFTGQFIRGSVFSPRYQYLLVTIILTIRICEIKPKRENTD